MRHTRLAAFLGVMIFCGNVFAQSLDPFVGTWTASWNSDTNEEYQGEIVIKPDGSTFKRYAKGVKGSRDPCFGREFPTSIEAKSASEIHVKVNASESMASCGNWSFDLTLIDPMHMEGKNSSSGRPIKAKKR